MYSPWQKTQWDFLFKRRQNNNLPHALLLAGDAGLGKQAFAQTFAKSLLCLANTKEGLACGQCRGCQLLQAGSHPDFYQLGPEEVGKSIRIDQVRELIYQLNQTAQQGHYKIAIIAPAEAMQVAAANALLKTLEEPTANTLIMLVSSQPGLLSATIRSRCQMLTFHQSGVVDAPLTEEQRERQQRLFEGLKKVSQNKLDPIQFAATWLKDSINEIVLWLTNAVMDLIRIKSGLPINAIANKEQSEFFQSLAPMASLTALFSYLDELYKIRQAINLAITLNQQLVLENVLESWYDCTRSHVKA